MTSSDFVELVVTYIYTGVLFSIGVVLQAAIKLIYRHKIDLHQWLFIALLSIAVWPVIILQAIGTKND